MKLKNIFWFCIINFILWCALCLKYYLVSGFYWDAPGLAFTISAIPGQMSLLFGGLLILCALARFMGPRAGRAACVAFGSASTLFLLIDIFIYSQYRFHISLAMLQLFFGPASREIFALPGVMYALTALCVLLVIALEFWLTFVSAKVKWGRRGVIAASIIIISAFVLFNAVYAAGRFFAVTSITAQVSYLPWANPVSVNSKMRKLGFEPREEYLSVSASGQFNYPRAPLTCQNSKKQNILIILIDSWRFDTFTKDMMPDTYAKFERGGYYFSRNVSGGNATQAGVFSLFYSMPSTYWDASMNTAPVLLSQAATQGYQMGIFSSGKLNSPEFHRNIFSSIENLRLSSEGEHKYQRDIDMQRGFEHFIRARDKSKPFFGFLFYDSPHGFDYPSDFKEKYSPAKGLNYMTLTASTDNTPYMNRYKNSVNFIDSKLTELFAYLKAQGALDNTIIVITGDHGQEINDTGNNFWGHNSNFTKYQTNTPLLVFWPGKKGGKLDYMTTHYDVVPTLMQGALGCSNPAGDYSIGQNLFDNTPRPYALVISYTNKAVVVGDKVSVLNNYGSMESYDDAYHKTTPVDSTAISSALKQMSVFYK